MASFTYEMVLSKTQEPLGPHEGENLHCGPAGAYRARFTL